MLVFTTDKRRLEEYFRNDPVLFAYHLGDLDAFEFANCLWAADFSERSRIRDVVLIYNGGRVPTVLAYGLSEHFGELLESVVPLLPDEFFGHFQEEYRRVFLGENREQALGTHLLMKLAAEAAPATALLSSEIASLGPEHESELLALYRQAYPGNYFVPRMLRTGRYVGYYRDGRLVATAGVHVCSDRYSMAVLGNIVTHPDYRGQGLAGGLTAYLSVGLKREGKTVCLKVAETNKPAIRCYEKLGFEKVHAHREALFRRRVV